MTGVSGLFAIHACAGHTMNFELITSPESECICKQNTNWKSLTFNMHSEFTALHGALQDFTNLKQKVEQIKISEKKKIIKLA